MDTSTLISARIDAAPLDASLANEGGRWMLTLRRTVPHPAEDVWPMLVDPERAARWSPVVPDRPLTSTGPATCRQHPSDPGVDAEVLVSDEPRELVHRCGHQILRWTLEPAEGAARLTLEHTFDKREDDGSLAAGWHICLAVLAAVLDGEDVERVVGMRALDYGWEGLKGRYEAAFA